MRWPWQKRTAAAHVRLGNPNRVAARHSPLRRESSLLKREASGEQPDSLTAGGERVLAGEANYLRRLIQPWQIRSFGYYDELGEIKYAAQFYSRALASLVLFAGERNEKGDIEETKEPEVIAALDRIRDPGGGGRTGLQGSYGRLMFLVGEALLFVSTDPGTKKEKWEMLSTDELRLMDGNYTRFKSPTLPATSFKPAPDEAYELVEDDEAVAYRLWRRHPRFSSLADSTMEGVLDLCEELMLLTLAVRARARSRIAGSGVLFLDDRITTQPAETTPDEDPLEDTFLADLTDTMTLPLVEEGTPSAVVPLVARVRVPDGMKLTDLVYHLQIVDPTQLYPETGLRRECIERIAIGLDMPPEILLGLQDSNHWSAWQVDEQVWKAHLQPIANQLVEDLTSAYLGPYLREQLGREDWDNFVIGYDASAIINHPDRTQDAKDLHDREAISDSALREAAGFNDEDAMKDEEEMQRRVGIKLRDGNFVKYGEPSVKAGGVQTGPEEILSPQSGPVGSPSGPNTVQPGAPPAGPPPAEETPETVIGSANARLAAQIEGAAQIGLLRAREAAGARLRNVFRRDNEALELLEDVQARDVACRLGRVRVRQRIGATESELVASARPLILDALRVFGVNGEVGTAISETVERHAERTLYEERPAPLPPTFRSYVEGLLAAEKQP